jgi:hypothetical protein
VKKVGSCLYAHRLNLGGLPASGLAAAQARIGDFDYDYVRHDTGSGSLTFVKCEGWDSLPEPVCRDGLRVGADGSVRPVPFSARNSQIIHGKHLFVRADYAGFDVDEAKRRWDSYQGRPWLDKARMGRLGWWRGNEWRIATDSDLVVD